MELHRRPRRLQCLAVRSVFIALAGIGLAQPLAAAGDEPTIARVRSTDPAVSALIGRAATQSKTFLRLFTAIQRSNGIVQVEVGTCGHGVRACLRMWMETAGSNRYLRVVIDRGKTDSDVEVMASIGHELQHAVEALSESGVTDGTLLYRFFQRLAPTDANRFETTTALRAGDDIRDELAHSVRISQRSSGQAGGPINDDGERLVAHGFDGHVE